MPFIIFGIEPLFRTVVQKYAEGKGFRGWLRKRVDHVGLDPSVSTFIFPER